MAHQHFFCTPCDPEWYEEISDDDDDTANGEGTPSVLGQEISSLSSGSFMPATPAGTPSNALLLEGNTQRRRLVANLQPGHDAPPVDPYTKDLVICNRSSIPVALLQTFPFTKNNSVVKGFTYDVEGGSVVRWDGDDGEEEVPQAHRDQQHGDSKLMKSISTNASKFDYARLITTNWWYSELMFTFGVASLIIMGKNANVLFCICLCGHQYDSTMPVWPRRLVSLAIVLLEGFQICVFCKVALREFHFKSNKNLSGDLVSGKTLKAADRNMPYIALALFHVLEVNILVKDIIKYCHPFKDKQPYAAFKADGHRAYLLGFRDSHSFQAAGGRPYSTLLSQIFIEAIMLIFKVISAIATRNVSFAVMSLPALFIIHMKSSECFKRAYHRKCYYQHLLNSHQDGDASEKKAAEKSLQKNFPELSGFALEELNERSLLLFKMALLVLLLGIVSYLLQAHIKWKHD